MAIKPGDGDVFLREVDEELRKERINNFVARYGWAIIAAVVLALGAIGGWLWWQHSKAQTAAAQGETLLEALDAMESGGAANAQPKIAELVDSNIPGYRAAGLFARANAELQANDNDAAIATLRSIAEDQGLDETYRNAALVRQTALEFDSLEPQAVIQRLGPLARQGEPWFGSAGELVGIAHLKMNRADLAGQLFGQIGRDETVPPSIRTRAIQMAGSLGVNALDEPDGADEENANQAAPAAAPAPAARESAE